MESPLPHTILFTSEQLQLGPASCGLSSTRQKVAEGQSKVTQVPNQHSCMLTWWSAQTLASPRSKTCCYLSAWQGVQQSGATPRRHDGDYQQKLPPVVVCCSLEQPHAAADGAACALQQGPDAMTMASQQYRGTVSCDHAQPPAGNQQCWPLSTPPSTTTAPPPLPKTQQTDTRQMHDCQPY